MENIEIKQIKSVIQPYLKPHEEIVQYETKPLTKAGENYGSLILAVTIKLKDQKSEKESILNIVAKLMPRNEWIQRMFNTPVTFRKEAALYSTISSTLHAFEAENNLSVWTMFPKYYGSRLSLDQTAEFGDKDAVLFLENLKLLGYETADRMLGFDLEASKLLVKCLARFHALPLALKLKKPKEFEEKVKKYLEHAPQFVDISERVSEQMCENAIANIRLNPDCEPYIDVIREYYKKGEKAFRYGSEPYEPFATICHNDFWVNNAMIKYEQNTVKEAVMVDFQILDYGSPARDLIFFLYTSVKLPILKEFFDNLVSLYYESFTEVLNSFGCDLAPFSFDAFLNEMAREAQDLELHHIIVMLSPIYTKKDDAKELDELSEDAMIENNYDEGYYERLWYIIKDFAKKKWI